MTPRRTSIVHGNCQAEAITVVLDKDPIVSSILKIVYSRSYIHPVEGKWKQRQRDVARCAVLYEQHDPEGFPKRAALPENCITVQFPSLDLNVLWPFTCANPYNRPEPPDFPFGRFPYGDRVIIAAIDQGMKAADIADYYLNGWDRFKVDLDRLLAIDTARLNARDQHCQVRMAPYIVENFSKKRLFWTVDHPTTTVLEELVEELLKASGRVDPHLADADIASTLALYFGARGPLGHTDVPIHPHIAEHFGLAWYDPQENVRLWDGNELSLEDYVIAMVNHAQAVKEERQPV